MVLRCTRSAVLRIGPGSVLVQQPTWGRLRTVELKRFPRSTIRTKRLLFRRTSSLTLDDDLYRVELDSRVSEKELEWIAEIAGGIFTGEIQI